VRDVAEDAEAEAPHAREHCAPGELVPGDDLAAPLEQQHACALARRVQHARRLGVVASASASSATSRTR
jgi:hypothetical protein